MKHYLTVAGIIIAIIVAGILATREKTRDTNVTKERTKVGFVLNGTKDDRSWGQAHFEGMEKTAEELNLEVLYRENIPEDERSVVVMEDLVKAGAEIVIANSFSFGEHELKVAEKHPQVKFFHATGVKKGPNLSTYFGRIYQMRYLSGIVAGLQTKTNEIGYVAAFGIPEVVRGINAFALGVHKVNPDAKVFVRWTNSWISDSLTGDAMYRLMENHKIDVISNHADSKRAYEIADSNGIWIVGYNYDNAGLYPKHFLTAPVWNWEKFYTARILEVLKNKFVSQSYWEGAESEVVSLAPLTENVDPRARDIVEAEWARLRNGEFDVFYGPIEDNEGRVRVEEGESMTDSDMLNDFNWFVKGVIVDER